MKKMIVALAVMAGLLSGCVVYDDGPHRGGPGNGFCPPGQAKKGNC